MANELFVALAKAQAQFPTIVKNRTNYNKGKYADLTAILDAVKPALAAQGVIIIQSPVTRILEGGGFVVDIITILAHGASGQTYEGILSMPTKPDAQSIGSAITYGRRYALVSMLALSADDDDGEEATKPARQTQKPHTNGNGHKPTPPAEEPSDDGAAAWAANPESVLMNGYMFKNPAEAQGWGMAMKVFNSPQHCENAYNEVKREAKPADAAAMWDAWINEVARRVNETKQAA